MWSERERGEGKDRQRRKRWEGGGVNVFTVSGVSGRVSSYSIRAQRSMVAGGDCCCCC